MGPLARLSERFFGRQIELDQPHRIAGDVLIRFSGSGRARFRLQHVSDRNGAPDELGWCEVSAMSNRMTRPEEILAGRMGGEPGVCGVLVDVIDGETDVLYRRHAADWIRVLPFDDGEEARQQCRNYIIMLNPV